MFCTFYGLVWQIAKSHQSYEVQLATFLTTVHYNKLAWQIKKIPYIY